MAGQDEKAASAVRFLLWTLTTELKRRRHDEARDIAATGVAVIHRRSRLMSAACQARAWAWKTLLSMRQSPSRRTITKKSV